MYIVHSFVKAKNICTGTPHGGPLHCAHISSNYIKFDQGQKDIARFVALYIPDEVFKHLLRSSYEP